MKLSWNWLKDYVTIKQTPEEAAERLTLAGLEVKSVARVGSDFMLETEVTSNRADWLSHIGVAREIAAIYRKKINLPVVKVATAKRMEGKINSVKIQNFTNCNYYSCVELTGIGQVKTPQWMKERLEVCGLRSINFLVDVTNYVLLETGQPLHAFDLEKLRGNSIFVRMAHSGEKFLAIDNLEYTLQKDDLVVADENGVIALAGVMGAKNSEVSDSTQRILLESAFFFPHSVRKTSRKLKLSSDSSYRFERGIDPLGVDFARERAVSLIQEHAGIEKIYTPRNSGKIKVLSNRITLNLSDLSRILGPIKISVGDVKSILNALQIKTRAVGSKIVSQIPTYRPDLTISEDLVEEVARIYGFDKISETIPSATLNLPKIDPVLCLSDQMCIQSENLGLQEVVTYSILNPQEYQKFESPTEKWVRIENPRNQNITLMRPSLVQSLIEVAGRNVAMGNQSISIFEIANTYHNTGNKLPDEIKKIGIVLSGNKSVSFLDQKRIFQFSDLKGLIERVFHKCGYALPQMLKVDSDAPVYLHRDYVYQVFLEDRVVGYCGLLKPTLAIQYRIENPVYYAELSIAAISSLAKALFTYQEISKYPFVERDLSLILDESVPAQEVMSQIRELGKLWIRQMHVFDLYRSNKLPKGKKSLAIRIEYQSHERTLSAAEVNELHFSIINKLSERFKAELPTKKD